MAFLVDAWQFVAGTLFPFLVVLTLIVFVHEMGHYLAGRWSGIGITAFSIGFGPEIPASMIAMARAGNCAPSRSAAT